MFINFHNEEGVKRVEESQVHIGWREEVRRRRGRRSLARENLWKILVIHYITNRMEVSGYSVGCVRGGLRLSETVDTSLWT